MLYEKEGKHCFCIAFNAFRCRQCILYKCLMRWIRGVECSLCLLKSIVMLRAHSYHWQLERKVQRYITNIVFYPFLFGNRWKLLAVKYWLLASLNNLRPRISVEGEEVNKLGERWKTAWHSWANYILLI